MRNELILDCSWQMAEGRLPIERSGKQNCFTHLKLWIGIYLGFVIWYL
jgi:hypothetical protein